MTSAVSDLPKGMVTPGTKSSPECEEDKHNDPRISLVKADVVVSKANHPGDDGDDQDTGSKHNLFIAQAVIKDQCTSHDVDHRPTCDQNVILVLFYVCMSIR